MTLDLSQMPNLPGFAIEARKAKHHRSQTWGFVNGQRMELREGLSHDKPKFVKAPKALGTWRTGSLPDSTTREVFTSSQFSVGAQAKDYDELPAWDALDRHVLRFRGYFKEAVVETNIENYRVRRCIIYYYLEDDTCHVAEPKENNSGIPQGNLIRRHRFPAANGAYVKPENLRIGEELLVYGRAIMVTGCDAFTREYYESIGAPQPAEDLDQATDAFRETQGGGEKGGSAAPERTYDKVYREVMLGGGHINENMQQFMENDRRVCRFFGVMDDLMTAQYERRPFTILVFLSDDTVEIREQYPLNCGRDNFPIFYRRGKMPKGAMELRGPMHSAQSEDEFFKAKDFFVGMTVNLVHNQFFIYDADEFTRKWFQTEYATDLAPRCDVRLPERAVPRPPTPPYTGYGSWDDSMSSVLHLIPKVPRKDYNKLFDNDGKILRFTAKFVDPKPEDVERRFVLNFHLFDDTLSIHEPPQRNLGIVTGRFLEKGVHLNQQTGQLFEPQDMLPGKIVSIFNTVFEVLDMDEYTRKYFEKGTVGGAEGGADLGAVLEKLRENMRQQFPLIRDIFRRFDSDHNGVITLAEFKQALGKFGFQLTEEETIMIMQHFDKRQDGQVTYNEFCDAVLEQDYSTQMLGSKPKLDPNGFDPVYAERTQEKTFERAETEKIRRAVREVGDVLYKHTSTVSKLFKEFAHMTHHQHVTLEQIHAALLKIGYTFDIADIQRAVLFVLPDVDLDKIDYVYFVKSVVACFHDLPATR